MNNLTDFDYYYVQALPVAFEIVKQNNQYFADEDYQKRKPVDINELTLIACQIAKNMIMRKQEASTFSIDANNRKPELPF